MSDQTQGSSGSSRSNNKRRRERRKQVAIDNLGRPVLAANGTVPVDSVDRQQKIRRQITQGLPSINRFFDPNRIVLEMPPDFQVPQELPERGKGKVVQRVEDTATRSRNAPHKSSKDLLNNPTNEKAMIVSVRTEPVSNLVVSGLASSSLITVLGAGRIDPFAKYPIQMKEGDLWLIDKVYTGSEPTLRTFRERWLPVAIRDSASFHQFLANVSVNLPLLEGRQNDDVFGHIHYALAIHNVKQKLSNASVRINDDVVISILSFICYNTVKGDHKSVDIHLAGLKDVIRLRGGFESIENNPILASLVFGVDITTSISRDTPPQFPIPRHILQNHQATLRSGLSDQAASARRWRPIFPHGHPIVLIFNDLHHAIITLDLNSAKVDFLNFKIYPILHRLLTITLIPPNNFSQTQPSSPEIKQETARLGVLLFLAPIRRKCGGLCISVSTKVQIRKLKLFMQRVRKSIDWVEEGELLLWAVFFALVESWGGEEQGWFAWWFREVVRMVGLGTWEEVMWRVKDFFWVDGVWEERMELVRGVIEGAAF